MNFHFSRHASGCAAGVSAAARIAALISTTAMSGRPQDFKGLSDILCNYFVALCDLLVTRVFRALGKRGRERLLAVEAAHEAAAEL